MSQVSGYYDSERMSDSDISGLGTTTHTETGRYLKSVNYSGVLFTEAIPPKAKYDNDDRTDIIYVEKVDFSGIRNDEDHIHLFLVPAPATSLYDFETLGEEGGFQQGKFTIFDFFHPSIILSILSIIGLISCGNKSVAQGNHIVLCGGGK